MSYGAIPMKKESGTGYTSLRVRYGARSRGKLGHAQLPLVA